MEQTAPVRPIFDLVVVDCPDALELARFYADLLGWIIEDGADRAWATLAPPSGRVSAETPGGPPGLAFQGIADWTAPTWPGGAHPQQMHLDLAVADIDEVEPWVLDLGARRHEHQPAEDGGFRVYLDPVGHPFCLVR